MFENSSQLLNIIYKCHTIQTLLVTVATRFLSIIRTWLFLTVNYDKKGVGFTVNLFITKHVHFVYIFCVDKPSSVESWLKTPEIGCPSRHVEYKGPFLWVISTDRLQVMFFILLKNNTKHWFNHSLKSYWLYLFSISSNTLTKTVNFKYVLIASSTRQHISNELRPTVTVKIFVSTPCFVVQLKKLSVLVKFSTTGISGMSLVIL